MNHTQSLAASETAALSDGGKEKRRKGISKRRQKETIFYIAVLAFPVLQFLIGYVATNFNSVLMAFQEYDFSGGVEAATIRFAGLNNFKRVFELFSGEEFAQMLLNSTLLYLFSTLLGLLLGIYFSYYIYKKHAGSGFFRIILLMPSVISGVVMILSFRFFLDTAYPALLESLFHKQVQGLLSNSSTDFAAIVCYNLLIGFGSVVLLFSGTMSGISDEIIEAAELDGANSVKEFFLIVIPMIWPTVITYVITGIASYFITDMGLFNLYGDKAESRLWTFGYYLFNNAQGSGAEYQFPVLSAMGVVFTVIVVPVTFLVKHLLEKFGPKGD